MHSLEKHAIEKPYLLVMVTTVFYNVPKDNVTFFTLQFIACFHILIRVKMQVRAVKSLWGIVTVSLGTIQCKK